MSDGLAHGPYARARYEDVGYRREGTMPAPAPPGRDMTEQQPAEMTPHPWVRRDASIGVIDQRDGVLIMTARTFSGAGSTVGEQLANAAFIVAAVNACAEAIGTDLKAREWLEAGGLQRQQDTLRKIACAPEGVYTRDRTQYLKNVIEWCQDSARKALL